MSGNFLLFGSQSADLDALDDEIRGGILDFNHRILRHVRLSWHRQEALDEDEVFGGIQATSNILRFRVFNYVMPHEINAILQFYHANILRWQASAIDMANIGVTPIQVMISIEGTEYLVNRVEDFQSIFDRINDRFRRRPAPNFRP